MTLKHFTAIATAGVLIGCGSAPKSETRLVEPQTHSFGIYLVATTPDRPWTPSMIGDLATLALAKVPLVSDGDILSYIFADHTIIVKPEVLSRLPKPSVFHSPFVVVVDGVRIYLGAFATEYSSYSSSAPTILVDHIAVDAQHWRFRGGTNALVIDRAYPAAGFGAGSDPRSDERIREALVGLKKLK